MIDRVDEVGMDSGWWSASRRYRQYFSIHLGEGLQKTLEDEDGDGDEVEDGKE